MQDFDVAVLGGGISGLYVVYNILRRSKSSRVVLLEKSNRIGGRIFTYKDRWMTVEAGAGRIHYGHRRILSLIRELGLTDKLREIDNHSVFRRSIVGSEPAEEPYRRILSRVIREASSRSKSYLVGKTLFEFTSEISGPSDAHLALDSFGYTTEFSHMNAYDAIKLMKIVALRQKYYVLDGGLSQVVEELVERIRKMGGTIQTGQSVESVIQRNGRSRLDGRDQDRLDGRSRLDGRDQDRLEIHCSNGRQYSASKCICTFPAKDVVSSVRFLGDAEFREKMAEWKRTIRSSIYGGSLCRIYSQLEHADWLTEKTTINDDLRIIIPMNNQVTMISYSDNKTADRWNKRMSEGGGVRAVNERLKSLIQKDIGVDPGQLKHTQVFYWPNAVGYWRVGADSESVEKLASTVSDSMFFCGENYSQKNQQWIEGSLDTADFVLSRILY